MKTKPNDVERVQILLCYLLQPNFFSTRLGIIPPTRGEIIGVEADIGAFKILEENGKVVEVPGMVVGVEVKKTSDISQQEAMHAMVLQGFKNTNEFTVKLIEPGFTWDDGNEWGTVFFNSLKYSAVDYLRSRGYALPYGPWSVDELVELEIFKLISTHEK